MASAGTFLPRSRNTLQELRDGAPAPNEALRELAGRFKRLSYRDMTALADALDLPAQNVLLAADALEKA